MTRNDFACFNGQMLVQVFKADPTLRRRIADFITAHDEKKVCRVLEMPRKGFARLALARVANGHPWPRVALDTVRRKLDELDSMKEGHHDAQ